MKCTKYKVPRWGSCGIMKFTIIVVNVNETTCKLAFGFNSRKEIKKRNSINDPDFNH